ncbi:hypothetical protein AL486_09690 [Pandoraea apista]|nr:hypothetical protein AL486_09690 [Pandoraea apista]
MIASHTGQIPRQEARALLMQRIDIAAMEGEFEHFVFSCSECIEGLHDRYSACMDSDFNDLAAHAHQHCRGARGLSERIAELTEERLR